MTMLYQAHSGLRYLVLLAAVVALVVIGVGLASGRPTRAARGLATAYTGLLDLQVLLGVGLVVGGIFYGALMGHIVMMVLAAVAAHAASVLARRQADERVALRMRFVGIAASLLCIVAGIMAIGRNVIGSAPPTLG